MTRGARDHLAAASARAAAAAIRAQAPQRAARDAARPASRRSRHRPPPARRARPTPWPPAPRDPPGFPSSSFRTSPFVAAAPRCPACGTFSFIRPMRAAERRQAQFYFGRACEARRAPSDRCARLPALHPWRFVDAGPRFRPRHFLRRSVQRAPRGAGRIARRAVSATPEPAVAGRSRGTPDLAPPSGTPLENGPHERGLTGLAHLHM